jgi:predicted secreted protein
MPERSSKLKVFTKDDRQIHVRAGERFVIELSGIPGAGYEWTLSPGSQTSITKREVFPSSGIGGAAVYRFHLVANAAGAEQLRAEYRRAWERQAESTAAFELRVTD